MMDRNDSTEGRILHFLDRGSWKHSWHLPKRCGNFDWLDQDAIDRVREEVTKARAHAYWLLEEASFAEQWARSCQQRADEEKVDDDQ